jgi:hypothetical protein
MHKFLATIAQFTPSKDALINRTMTDTRGDTIRVLWAYALVNGDTGCIFEDQRGVRYMDSLDRLCDFSDYHWD